MQPEWHLHETPESIQVTILLPGVTAAEIEATVDSTSLEVVAGEYCLQAELPHTVVDDELKCQFDKTEATLVISAPRVVTDAEIVTASESVTSAVSESVHTSAVQVMGNGDENKVAAAAFPGPASLHKTGVQEYIQTPGRPLVFLEVEWGSERARGRVIIELFADIVPHTAENFRCLCTGERGVSASGKMLHYKGSTFHRVFPGWVLEGGGLAEDHSLRGGESIYGDSFPDENFHLLHSKAGIVSMVQASAPNDGNTSIFYIDLKACPHLNGKNVVFGQVVSGMDVVRSLETVEREARETGNTLWDMQHGQHAVWPIHPIMIVDCGEVENLFFDLP